MGAEKPGEEGDPAGHEAPLRPEGVREIDVLAAGAGKIDAQFGIAQGAGKGEQRAHRPAGKNQPGAAEIARHETGGGEDAGAHHVGDHQRGGAEEAELAQQARVENGRVALGHSGLMAIVGYRAPGT